MGRAVTPSQDCTAVAEREARALVFFCTGTCWDEWLAAGARWSQALPANGFPLP